MPRPSSREHNEPGTLSARHLQRLASGRQRIVCPATARLLEHIVGRTITELLAPLAADRPVTTPHPLRVAIAVVAKDDDVLLVCRRTDHSGLTRQFPAGIIKPGENPEVVAIRETLAETGIHCAATSHLGSRVHPITRVHCDYFLCEHVAGVPENTDVTENAIVAWVCSAKLTRLIPVDQLFRPVLKILPPRQSSLSSG